MERWTRKGETLTAIILAIFRVNGELLSEGDRIAGVFDQSSARWQVLGAIESDPATVPGIARDMGLTRQSVQRTVDLLVADGLVEYLDNPAHRRSRLVAMTAHGRDVYDRICRRQVKWVNRLAESLGVRAQDLDAMLEVLERIDRTLGAEPQELDARTGRRGA